MFIAGLIGLIAGAELLVRGASRLALSFGISPLVVGPDHRRFRHQRA